MCAACSSRIVRSCASSASLLRRESWMRSPATASAASDDGSRVESCQAGALEPAARCRNNRSNVNRTFAKQEQQRIVKRH